MRVLGDKIAPIKHFSLSEPSDDRDIDSRTLEKITEEVGIMIYIHVFLYPLIFMYSVQFSLLTKRLQNMILELV